MRISNHSFSHYFHIKYLTKPFPNYIIEVEIVISMRAKRFEYRHKDIPFLKKDIAFRIVFTFLFFAIFLWQLIIMFYNHSQGTLTNVMLIVSIFVLVGSLIFTLTAMLYAFRSINIINSIKRKGKAVRVVTTLRNNDKGSFIKLYSIITQIIAVVVLLVLVSALTYSILELVYYSSVSFYMPVLFLFAFSGFNSVYHINAEIDLIQNVKEFSSIY